MASSGTPISTVVAGANYNSGTDEFTFSASELATASGILWSGNDSIEQFTYMLLQALYNFQYKSGTTYDANTNLYAISSRNVSSYAWADYTENSTIITHTISHPFTTEVSEISADSLGANA